MNITKCRGGGCELTATCRRYTEVSIPGQKMYSVPPVEADGKSCPQYLPADMGAPVALRVTPQAPVKVPAKAPEPTSPPPGSIPLIPLQTIQEASKARKDRAKKERAAKPKPLPKAATGATVPVSSSVQPQTSEDDMALLSPTQLKPLKGQKQHPMHKAKSKDGPTHVTAAGTCKYQTNGPVNWAQEFRKIAREIGGPGAPVGIGIRAVLAAGLSVPQEKIVKMAHGATKAVQMIPGKESTS